MARTPSKVSLSDSERIQARRLAHLGIKLSVRTEAAKLLELGANPDDLWDLRISCTTSLCGHRVAMERFGVPSLRACELAQGRVRGLVDTALYLTVLYDIGKTAPPPLYLGSCSGLGGGPGTGLAFSCSSQMDPTITVKRYPSPVQEELWDADDVPWTELARLRDEFYSLTA